jgi:hypothetical protein
MTDKRRYPLKLDELKAAFEQKARKRAKPRTRRVRTAEGAKKYGVPIGSIIVLDANGKPIKRGTAKPDQPTVNVSSSAPAVSANDAGQFNPGNYGKARDAKGQEVQVGGEYKVGKSGGSWFVDVVNDDGTVKLYQVDKYGNEVGTMNSLSNRLIPVAVVLDKDGKRLEAGQTVILDGDESKVYTIDSITTAGKSMTVSYFNPLTGQTEVTKGVRPGRASDGSNVIAKDPKGVARDRNNEVIIRDEWVRIATGGPNSFDTYQIGKVHDDGQVSLLREERATGNLFPAGTYSADQLVKTRAPEVIHKDFDGEPPLYGEKYRLRGDDDSQGVEYYIDTMDRTTKRVSLVQRDPFGKVIPGTKRTNVHPNRIERTQKPGETAHDKTGSLVKIGNRYKIEGTGDYYAGEWELVGFKRGRAGQKEPNVLMMRIKDDGKLDTSDVFETGAEDLIPNEYEWDHRRAQLRIGNRTVQVREDRRLQQQRVRRHQLQRRTIRSEVGQQRHTVGRRRSTQRVRRQRG